MSLETAADAGSALSTTATDDKAATIFTKKNVAIALVAVVVTAGLVYCIMKVMQSYKAKRLAQKAAEPTAAKPAEKPAEQKAA